MKQLGSGILTLIVIIFHATGIFAADHEPVKIGAILSLSGDYAYIGTEMQRGIELALSDANPGLVKVVYEDDHTLNNAESVKALKKLLDVDRVQAVINMSVNSMSALYPIIKKKQVPVVVVWDNNKLLESMAPYAFSVGYNNEETGRALAEFVFGELKIRKASVISTLDKWSEIMAEAFAAHFAVLGGKINLHEKVNPELSDFRSLIFKVKQKNTGAIYFPLVLNRGVFIKQVRNFEFQGALLSTELTDGEVKNASRAADGVYSAQVWFQDREFSGKYRKRYGSVNNAEALGFAKYGYDSLSRIVAAIKYLDTKKTEVNRKSLLKALEAESVSGSINTLKIMKVMEGKFALLSGEAAK